MTPEQAKEYREEAERLAQLPDAEQRAVLAWHRDIAADPRTKRADRKAAEERAEFLERLLSPPKTKKEENKT